MRSGTIANSATNANPTRVKKTIFFIYMFLSRYKAHNAWESVGTPRFPDFVFTVALRDFICQRFAFFGISDCERKLRQFIALALVTFSEQPKRDLLNIQPMRAACVAPRTDALERVLVWRNHP